MNRCREIRVGDVVALYKSYVNSKMYFWKVLKITEYGVECVQLDHCYPDDVKDLNCGIYPIDNPVSSDTHTFQKTKCPWVISPHSYQHPEYYVLWSGLNVRLINDFKKSGIISPHDGKQDYYFDLEFDEDDSKWEKDSKTLIKTLLDEKLYDSNPPIFYNKGKVEIELEEKSRKRANNIKEKMNTKKARNNFKEDKVEDKDKEDKEEDKDKEDNSEETKERRKQKEKIM